MQSQVKTGSPPHQWPLLFIGVLLVVAGPIIYYIQFRQNILKTPWYAPVLATLGALCFAVALARRHSLFRLVALVLMILVGAFEWYMILVGTRSPVYTGPATVGRPVPTFVTTRADGSSFSNRDLAAGKPTVLLFFRGRW